MRQRSAPPRSLRSWIGPGSATPIPIQIPADAYSSPFGIARLRCAPRPMATPPSRTLPAALGKYPPTRSGKKLHKRPVLGPFSPMEFFITLKPVFRISAIGHTSRTLPAALGKYPPTRSAGKVHERPVLGPCSPMDFFTTQNRISGSRPSATHPSPSPMQCQLEI